MERERERVCVCACVCVCVTDTDACADLHAAQVDEAQKKQAANILKGLTDAHEPQHTNETPELLDSFQGSVSHCKRSEDNHTHAHMHAYIHTHMDTHTRTHAHTHTRTHARTHACMFTYTWTHEHPFLPTCLNASGGDGSKSGGGERVAEKDVGAGPRKRKTWKAMVHDPQVECKAVFGDDFDDVLGTSSKCSGE